MLRKFLLFAFLTCSTSVSADTELLLITSKTNTLSTLNLKDVTDLFLGRVSHLQGLKPVDQADEKARNQFYKSVTGMSPHRVRAHWVKRVFTGRGRPPQRLTLEQIKQAIASHSNIVTYVQIDQIPEQSNLLMTIDSEVE